LTRCVAGAVENESAGPKAKAANEVDVIKPRVAAGSYPFLLMIDGFYSQSG
jgi:hypothetical protein